MITYANEPNLTPDEFIAVLNRSTLAERRPVEDQCQIAGMLANAGIIITARYDGQLVGVARSISDFHYCTYLSDLAVDEDFQRQGIGKRLIDETHKSIGFRGTLILLAAPKAREYYPRIGMEPHDSCWISSRPLSDAQSETE